MAVSINQKAEQIVLQMTLEYFTCIIQMIKADKAESTHLQQAWITTGYIPKGNLWVKISSELKA